MSASEGWDNSDSRLDKMFIVPRRTSGTGASCNYLVRTPSGRLTLCGEHYCWQIYVRHHKGGPAPVYTRGGKPMLVCKIHLGVTYTGLVLPYLIDGVVDDVKKNGKALDDMLEWLETFEKDRIKP